MVSTTFQMQPLYRPMPLTVDTAHTQQKFFDEEDSSILDENILDQSAIDSGLEMSPAMIDSRRESFAIGSSLFSPKQDDWQSVEMQSVPSNNPFLEQHQPQTHHQHQHPHQHQHQHHPPHPHSNNPFMRLDHSQHQPQTAHTFTPQPTWSSMGTASTATPAASVPAFDGLPAEFDSSSSTVFQRGSIPFSNPTNHVAMFSSANSQASLPTSPQKEHWSGNMAMNKKVRPSSPMIRSHNELRKGDGIRKKNARFDIPAERNLSNIDQLIAQSTDEQEIKELKQQKRLLRNRQAALDSRQRKKQHTERLEDEKKVYTAHIQALDDEIEEMRTSMNQLMSEKQQLSNFIEALTMEKEEMIRQHTIEAADLRKQIKVLTNHIESLEGSEMGGPSSNMSGMQDANGASGDYPGAFASEMEGLSMDGNNWDGMGFMNDFPAMEPTPVSEIKQEMPPQQLVVVGKKQQELPAHADADESSSRGNIFFLLFLYGALIASRSLPTVPRVSEDVRAASATILENVMKDAGVAESGSTLGLSTQQPSSAVVWPKASPVVASSSRPTASAPATAVGLDGLAPSMLGDLGDLTDSLTQPTAEQTKEQLFSMTPAQYNGMTSQDFLHNPTPAAERSTSQGRRNLAEALASTRQGHGGQGGHHGGTQSAGKADVYTRSLLWDQIPSDVVRTFVKMVAECNGSNANSNSNSNSACVSTGGDSDGRRSD